MPLTERIELPGDTYIGIWKMEEDASYFLSRLVLNEEEKAYIQNISHGKRYLQWLSSRVLIKELLQTNEFVELSNDEQGKPVLRSLPYHLSITHSFEYAGVILSRQFPVGIDIEQLHPKIERIAHRFMTGQDLNALDFEYQVEQMYVYWCAKEALYKLYGKRALNFKEHIFIEPFDYMHAGEIKGRIEKHDYRRRFTIQYEKLDDYMMAYVADGGQ